MALNRVEERYDRSFEATDDAGTKYTLDIYYNFNISQPLSGPPTETKGLMVIRTRDDADVSAMGGGKFWIVGTRKYLHSTDPTAPQ